MGTDFDEFERRGLESGMRAIVRGRIVAVFVVGSFGAWVAFVDPSMWRRVLLGTVLIALLGLDIRTRQRIGRHGFESSTVYLNFALTVAFQTSVVLATGALASPVLPVLLPSAFAIGLLFGWKGVRRVVLTFQVPMFAVFIALHLSGAVPDLVPTAFRAPAGPNPVALVVLGIVMMAITGMLAMLGWRLRNLIQSHLDVVATAHDRVLYENRERVEEMRSLTGEIAHELKNPLSSIKGLAQLIARGQPRGDTKTDERLAVLQREVGRMEAVLDEFLNFSRPLLPLQRKEVQVEAVCREVATLHEVAAAERSVRLRVQVSPELRFCGDARKLAQVLINLVQNALDVAPPGTEVTLSARRSDDGVRLEVRDRGSGIDPNIADRLFKPGVTTKALGNGLGLTIARAIAAQHGGTLELFDAEGGGCRAVVSLPYDGRGGVS